MLGFGTSDRSQATTTQNTPSLSPCVSGTDLDNQNQQPTPIKRASTTFYDRIITDWWWWELGSWLVSFACVATIVGLLVFYDGKKQPDHVIGGITLNAIIAIFAAVAKAALILPVSEAIGQLKWIWFRSERRLFDFFAFDNASRGPWGSAMLLVRTKCRHLASIGAAITVLALAFEPFFQQSVTFTARDIVKASGTISIATSFRPINDIQYRVTTGYAWSGVDYGAAIRSTAFDIANAISTPNQSVRSAPSSCPTERCTWAPYSSLGVCHRCKDVSQLVAPVCQQRSMAFPEGTGGSAVEPCGYQINGTFLTGTYGLWDRKTVGLATFMAKTQTRQNMTPVYWNSTVFANAPNALLDFYIGFVPGGDAQILRNATPVLLECLFQWCVKTFQATHVNGSLEEEVMSVYLPPDTESPTQLGFLKNTPATFGTAPNDPFVMTAAGKSFRVGANTTRLLSNSLTANLPTFMGNDSFDATKQYPGRWSFVQSAPHDVDSVLGPIAEAMTNSIRSTVNSGTEQAVGDAWGSEVFVQTQWLWLLLPVALLLSTLILVCATIVQSRKKRIPSWKSSSLATLLHGLAEEAREKFAQDTTQSEVEALSQKLRVRFIAQGTHGSLVPV
ncbi:hypothetical protein BKA63DRAFT_216226 [Paraphoma chrysanthemicola]|nr:hypothetical protein BKA63DRAFT_216226 [Paraphoma chrysanthemicola]